MNAYRTIRFAFLILPGLLATYQTTWAFPFIDLIEHPPGIHHVISHDKYVGNPINPYVTIDRYATTVYVGGYFQNKVPRRFIHEFTQIKKNVLGTGVRQLEQVSWQNSETLKYQKPHSV